METCELCGHKSEGITVFLTIYLDNNQNVLDFGNQTHLTIDEKYKLSTKASQSITICSNRTRCQKRQDQKLYRKYIR